MTTTYAAPDLDFDDLVGALARKSDAELKAARFVLGTIQKPWLLTTGKTLARAGLALRIPGAVTAIERTVFRQFCGGTNLDQAIERAARLHEHRVGTILDFAVEGEDDEADSDSVSDEIVRAVTAAGAHPEIEFAAIKLTGVARFALLEKLNRGSELSTAEAQEFERSQARLEKIANCAEQHNTSIFVDAEHSWVQDTIDDETERLMAAYNQGRAIVHHTVQLYLRTGLPYLEKAVARARAGGYQFGVKLVRGAYLEQENDRAERLGVETRVQASKDETDRDYDAATSFCLENIDVVSVCVATHNVDSVRHLVAEMARLGIPADDPRVSSSQLLGMFDRVTMPLADAGYNVLKYVPYGGVRDAFPYLLRRANENKSVASQLASELEAVRKELKRRRTVRP